MNTTELLKHLNEGYDHTLPSGLTVKLRRLQLVHYLRHGTLPGHLQAMVEHFTAGNTLKNTIETHADHAKDFFEWVVCETCAEPKLAVEPQDADTLPLDYLPELDKSAIFTMAFKPVQEQIEAIRPLSSKEAETPSSSSTRRRKDTTSDPAAS